MESSTIIKSGWVRSAVVGVVAFAGGAGLGYILGKRSGTVTIVPPEPEKPVVSTEQLKALTEDPEFLALLEEEEAILNRSKEQVVVQEIEDEAETEDASEVVVIANLDPYWNYEYELQNRSREAPYVIHQDEFIGEEMGFQQETLTYYAGDDIMADPRDTPIYNYQGLMGELKFGHGSRNPDIVYIRNEQIRMEWEVLLDKGHFAVEVMGLSMEKEADDELRHSGHSVPKFRRE